MMVGVVRRTHASDAGVIRESAHESHRTSRRPRRSPDEVNERFLPPTLRSRPNRDQSHGPAHAAGPDRSAGRLISRVGSLFLFRKFRKIVNPTPTSERGFPKSNGPEKQELLYLIGRKRIGQPHLDGQWRSQPKGRGN